MKTLIIESSILIKADNNFISGPTQDAIDRRQQKIQEVLDNHNLSLHKDFLDRNPDFKIENLPNNTKILSHNTNHTLVECNNSTRLILVDTLILQ